MTPLARPPVRLRQALLPTCLFVFVTFSMPAAAAWGDWLDAITEVLESDVASDSLAESDVIAGLKEALNTGSRIAVDQLGANNGYFSNPDVRIPMPEQLLQVESALRSVGQQQLADDFVLSMNRAAEQAVPMAADILYRIVQGMTVQDAYGILNGADDAATSYLRKHGAADLTAQFQPVVARATDSVGVTRNYKALTANLGMVSQFIDTSALDVDSYVTNKAIDGLFMLVAEEERRIRENPAARTTELLQKVFSTQ